MNSSFVSQGGTLKKSLAEIIDIIEVKNGAIVVINEPVTWILENRLQQILYTTPSISDFSYILDKSDSLWFLNNVWSGITVYAPTNAAFKAAGINVYTLTKKQMVEIINAHIVNTRVGHRTIDYSTNLSNRFNRNPRRFNGLEYIPQVDSTLVPHEFINEYEFKYYNTHSVIHFVSKMTDRSHWEGALARDWIPSPGGIENLGNSDLIKHLGDPKLIFSFSLASKHIAATADIEKCVYLYIASDPLGGDKSGNYNASHVYCDKDGKKGTLRFSPFLNENFNIG